MKLKYEDYTEKTTLVIELSEVLAGYTVFTTGSEFSFQHRLNLVQSVHLSKLCIQIVFTDGTTKVLILGDDKPYWSETEIKPDFGSNYPSATQLLEKMKQVVVDYLYEELDSEI
jgi:hypothetical protein